MPEFRTSLPTPTSPVRIHHEKQLFCMGSCFAEHIGQRLRQYKFSTVLNPFGIIYNPISIQIGLAMLQNDFHFTEKNIFHHQGLWHSYYHHGSFSSLSSSELMEHVEYSLQNARKALQNTDCLLLTLGTAFVFIHRKLGEVVANCHKLPAQEFNRRRLSVKEIVNALAPIFQQLKAQRPELDIILTVSPVRHLRDGFVENQRSKATLILALDELCQQLDFVHYFPAYELLLDDLRDYRFYAADMLHPAPLAIDYIWNYFGETFFDKTTQSINKQIEKIQKATQHRPFHPQSAEHQQFISNQLEKIQTLQQQYPFLNFKEERAALEQQLN